jgi:hypothetical protein
MLNIDNPQFVADKLIAQELLLKITINSMISLYPEVTQKIIEGLDFVLDSTAIPTPGALANLEKIREQLAQAQSIPPSPH